ncbi:MAG: hypothetical protein ACREE9_05545 [Stellaceae bacterium]
MVDGDSDGYAPMAQFFLEGFKWHGVKRGDAFAFYAGDIGVEGPHPVLLPSRGFDIIAINDYNDGMLTVAPR